MTVPQPTFATSHLVKSRSLAISGISALLLLPCFWHRRIEAGDLPSHVYNAWLAQLVQQGKASGLYTVWQWTNVLFDLLLLYCSKLFGFTFGPKVAVAVCVLIFFWGVFAMAAKASGRWPWLLTPLLAMLAYGFTFNMGFFNYYLSLGLGCFALTFFWNRKKQDLLLGAIFLMLVILAHPLGSLWAVATPLYVWLRKRLPTPLGFAIPAAAIAIFGGVHWYFLRTTKIEVAWPEAPFYFWNGADQFIVYSAFTRWIAIACLLIAGAWIGYGILHWKQHSETHKKFPLLTELYVLSFIITCLLPQDLRPHPDGPWMGVLVARLTLITAIFGLCALSSLRPNKPLAAALAICAVAYFVLLYRDTATINRLEQNAEALTANLPYGTLVIPTIRTPDSRIPFIGHVVDRACIGHCFIYSNYEPPSADFRVRATEDSPVIVSNEGDSEEMEAGAYIVQPTDPPFINIYQCSEFDPTIVCARKLVPGDHTGPPAH
jgi:hypothetical protein